MKRTRRAQHEPPAQTAQIAPAVDGGGDEDTAPVPPDRTGWTAHPGERRDFLNRVRAFPPDVASWRRRMQERIPADPSRFPLAAALQGEQLTGALDAGITYLREVARILAVLYGTPDLGNKADPTDELVYILL